MHTVLCTLQGKSSFCAKAKTKTSAYHANSAKDTTKQNIRQRLSSLPTVPKTHLFQVSFSNADTACLVCILCCVHCKAKVPSALKQRQKCLLTTQTVLKTQRSKTSPMETQLNQDIVSRFIWRLWTKISHTFFVLVPIKSPRAIIFQAVLKFRSSAFGSSRGHIRLKVKNNKV